MPTTTVKVDDIVSTVKAAKNDIYQSDDLEGCTVVAAVWEPSGSQYPALFAHFGATTIQEGQTANKAFWAKVHKELDDAVVDESNPELPQHAYLVYAFDADGRTEKFKKGNDEVRAVLRKYGITAKEEGYKIPTGKVPHVIQLVVGAADPLINP